MICRLPKPTWYTKLKDLNVTIQHYLRACNDAPPTITKCTPRNPHNGYQSNRSIKNHCKNVLYCLSYKCDGNNVIYKQLRSAIGKEWKNDLLQEWQIKSQLTPHETERLQHLSAMSDHPWNNFKTEFNRIWGSRVFASKGQTSQIRAANKPQTGRVRNLDLKSDQNKYDSRERHNYTIFYMRECEIISNALDKFINNNEFVWMDLFGRQIFAQYGGDKAKKGGYYDTICLGGPTFSVKNSMISLYIPGNVSENNSNLHKCYQIMNYDKIAYWRSLSKKPCIMSLVFYCCSCDAILQSRCVQSCVIAINPMKQALLNAVHNQQSATKVECQFATEQFDFEWTLLKSKQKQQQNHWKTVLSEMKKWEARYERPKDLALLSEQERKGNFDTKRRS